MGLRHATRVKNPGGQVVLGGNNVSPLVDIGLTDPLKSGGGGGCPPCLPACCMPVTLFYVGKFASPRQDNA